MFKTLPGTGFFTVFMGAQHLVVESDNMIQFSNVPGPFKGVRVSKSTPVRS